MYYTIGSSNELYHYGIKGMKWGVRKSEEERAADYRKKKAGKIEKKMNRLLARNQRKYMDSTKGKTEAERISAIYNKKMKDALNMSINDIKLEKMIKRNNVRRVVSGVLAAASVAASVAGIFSPVGMAVSAGLKGAGGYQLRNMNYNSGEDVFGSWYTYTQPTKFGAIVGSVGESLAALARKNTVGSAGYTSFYDGPIRMNSNGSLSRM